VTGAVGLPRNGAENVTASSSRLSRPAEFERHLDARARCEARRADSASTVVVETAGRGGNSRPKSWRKAPPDGNTWLLGNHANPRNEPRALLEVDTTR